MNSDRAKRLEYMADPEFKLKWGLVYWAVRQYSRWRPRILDLGCGPFPFPDLFPEVDPDFYLGIDSYAPIIRGRQETESIRYVVGDIRSLDGAALAGEHGLFDLILWAGVACQWKEWQRIIPRILPAIGEGGALIMEYWDQPPDLETRMAGICGITHVNGCGLQADYAPEQHAPTMPTVYRRRLEIFIRTPSDRPVFIRRRRK